MEVELGDSQPIYRYRCEIKHTGCLNFKWNPSSKNQTPMYGIEVFGIQIPLYNNVNFVY